MCSSSVCTDSARYCRAGRDSKPHTYIKLYLQTETFCTTTSRYFLYLFVLRARLTIYEATAMCVCVCVCVCVCGCVCVCVCVCILNAHEQWTCRRLTYPITVSGFLNALLFWHGRSFLKANARWRRATISFVMSVRPSVRMEQLGSLLMDFHEIWYFEHFPKICGENSSVIKTWEE